MRSDKDSYALAIRQQADGILGINLKLFRLIMSRLCCLSYSNLVHILDISYKFVPQKFKLQITLRILLPEQRRVFCVHRVTLVTACDRSRSPNASRLPASILLLPHPVNGESRHFSASEAV